MLSWQFLHLLPGILVVWIVIVARFAVMLYRAGKGHGSKVVAISRQTARARGVRASVR